MRLLYRKFAVTLLAILTLQPTIASTLMCTAPGPIDGRYFGMHIHRFHDPRLMPSIKFGSWRLWDSGTSWKDLQPAKETWDFRRLELAISIAKQRGVEVGLVLGMTPRWAAARPTEHSFGGEGAASEPRDFTDWDNYIRTIARRYKGRIQFYEIWNEPASAGFYTGTVPQMVELARRAYQIIKEEDPEAIVVSPSPAKAVSISWLSQFVRAGGMNHVDVVGYHFYTDTKKPEDLIGLVKLVRNVLVSQGITKPLWNTESGVAHDNTSNSGLDVGPAAHVARWLILGACLGLERFHYYAWDNGELGLFDPKQISMLQQGVAYAQVEKWLEASVMTTCEFKQRWTECTLKKNGKHYSILWTNSEVYLADIGNFKYAEDSFGAVLENPPETLPLGATPILVW
jgi:hypothetical protein